MGDEKYRLKPEKLEQELNDLAGQGWKVISCTLG